MHGRTYSTKTIERILSQAAQRKEEPRDPMTQEPIPPTVNDKNYPRNRNLEEVLKIISSSVTGELEKPADVAGEALANGRAYFPHHMMPSARNSNFSSSSSASNSASSSNGRFSPFPS